MTSENAKQGTQQATFGGGCFWCLEAVIEQLQGVSKVESGYCGGHVADPTYQQVCTGATGHAEVIQVTFDPVHITYRELLEVFLAMHDPTTLNRQGADVGTQYRSVIFYHHDAQRQIADAIILELSAAQIWNRPIVTQVVPGETFYAAEDYHQGYFRSNSYQPYCQAVISPKVAKLRQKFADKFVPSRGL
jgi:peptide-methionine (S)-S-oxide reductase